MKMPFVLHWVREQLRSLRRRVRQWEAESMREAGRSMHSVSTVAREGCETCGGFTATRVDGSTWGWHKATCPSSDDVFKMPHGTRLP